MQPDSASDKGVIYVAFGETYRKLAVLSISYLRRYGYSGPVRILTDFSGWDLSCLDCEVLEVPSTGPGFGTRHYKTRLNEYGFDTTLFLDADTVPVSSIDDIWNELRTADVCLSRDRHPDVMDLVSRGGGHKSTWLPGEPSPDRRHPEYEHMAALGLMRHPLHSSGVMLFRRSAVTDLLFRTWHEEWKRFGHEDQLALVRALSRTGCHIDELPACWNARMKGWNAAKNSWPRHARILHLRPENGGLPESVFDQPAFNAPKNGSANSSRIWMRALNTAKRARAALTGGRSHKR
ncbi:MAG TPA: hypothetical protein VG322_03235 [Candidatus Acidoferrales bacterium]|jgi:hypothetical protein|nr:hypothetical protein [Candidatus Acidoferrales bacterium]